MEENLSARPLRIAFGRISQETNALSPVLTTMEDFERTHLLRGEALLEACDPKKVEAQGFLRNAELSGLVRAARRSGREVELIPLISAWTVPGGPMSVDTYLQLRSELLGRLHDSGPVDAVFLSLHGALCVPNLADPEGDILRCVRGIVGAVPIAITLDMHANLTPTKVRQATIICAYRTNPHRDHARVGLRAGEILLASLAGDVRPTVAWRTLPLVLGGGKTVDFLNPMRSIFRWMKRKERDPRVLYISLFQCQLWLDQKEVGWSTHVITDGDSELAEELAEELADLCWAVREQQPPSFPGADEAIARARKAWWARRFGTVLMCDASDVVGAGSTGDNTRLLAALMDKGRGLQSYLSVRDPVAVNELWNVADGDSVQTWIGGRLDQRNDPVLMRAQVVRKHVAHNFGRMVLLRQGHLHVVLTEGANYVMRPSFYTQIGLDPWRADIVVVKSLFPFRIFFALQNRRTIYVRTKGITDFDAALRELEYGCPVWPRDKVEAWRPTDRRRRGQLSLDIELPLLPVAPFVSPQLEPAFAGASMGFGLRTSVEDAANKPIVIVEKTGTDS
jgi:microcystin degradation protein MlrC